MAYNEMKVSELRDLCAARGLAKSGVKNVLISRLEMNEPEKSIKQEANEMQIDIPIIQQQQEVPASPKVSRAGPSHETMNNNIKYEFEPSNNLLQQSMNIEEIPIEDSSLEQDIPTKVEVSNEYPQSIDPVEQQQQQIDQLPTVSSPVATSPRADVSTVEVPPSNNISFEQNNNHDQSKPTDSSEKMCPTYQKDDLRSEIERELARLMSERKSGTLNLNDPRLFSRGMTNQSNGVPYDYDFLLDIIQKSEKYKSEEIPDWLRYDYDTTFGTKYFGESECVRNIGIPVEELFEFE